MQLNDHTMLDYALAYEELGWFILPLKPGEKRPYVEWKDRRDRRPDKAEITSWFQKFPDAQIGMATGKYSGIDVLDFDNTSVSIPHFEAVVHDLPETFNVISGRADGGQHEYYKHNGSAFKNIVKPKDKNGFKIDVDVRTTGGIVVLPPSRHKDGPIYKWGKLNPLDMDDWRDELQEMPKKMVTFFENASSSDGDSVKLNLEQILSGIGEGERDVLIFKYCCRLRAKNLEYAEAKAMVINLANDCKPKFPVKEAIKKLDQAWKYEPGQKSLPAPPKVLPAGCSPVPLPVPPASWEAPVFLKENTAPPIDPSILNGIIGDMARAVSEETETPLELAVGLILSVLGTACQGNFIVNVKPGYREPVNIWIVSALDPANRKSSVLIKLTKPLTQYEQLKKIQMEPIIRDASSKRQNQEARIKSLRTAYGKAKQTDLKKIEDEILEMERKMVEVPVYPKFWCQDVTPEHLGTLLNVHAEKMSILSAEGGIFDIIGGRYSNGIGNLDLFLQAHSGDPVRVDRGSREPVFLDNPCLTMGLSPQPEVLRGLIDKPGFRGKGLLARFFYFLPKSNLGNRGLDSKPVPEALKAGYQDLIYRLLDITPGEDKHGKRQPYNLNLSGTAYQMWADFYMANENELREGGRFEHLTDWAGKLPGAVIRIAGLLHCAENPVQPWTRDISPGTMQAALGLAACFADHALIAFGLMGADRAIEDAQKVWRWVEKNRSDVFTKRDCFNALKGSFSRVSDIEGPLKVLEERNYIQSTTKQTGGRPSVQYTVNPEILKGWA